MADVEQNSPQTVNSASNYGIIQKESLPKERKNRAVWVSSGIFVVTSGVILFIAFYYDQYHIEYIPVERNATSVCYEKSEKRAFPGFFAAALSLLSIIFGTLLDRLSLVAEECTHVTERYDGSYCKMFRACFKGIYWKPVFLFGAVTSFIVVLIMTIAGLPWKTSSHLVYIFGGIGVGPLVIHLLNLNALSEVHLSKISEEKELFIAKGLAWSYYFNYLKKALPDLRNYIDSNTQRQLIVDKLVLLVPLDCDAPNTINSLDQNIKLDDTIGDHHQFHVYKLTLGQNEHDEYVAMQYVKEPLNTLRDMSLDDECKGINNSNYIDEVKLLCRELSKILSDTRREETAGMCLLVPFEATRSQLSNGGLVRFIMDKVSESSENNGPQVKKKKTITDKIMKYRYRKNKKTTVDGSKSQQSKRRTRRDAQDNDIQSHLVKIPDKQGNKKEQEHGMEEIKKVDCTTKASNEHQETEEDIGHASGSNATDQLITVHRVSSDESFSSNTEMLTTSMC